MKPVYEPLEAGTLKDYDRAISEQNYEVAWQLAVSLALGKQDQNGERLL